MNVSIFPSSASSSRDTSRVVVVPWCTLSRGERRPSRDKKNRKTASSRIRVTTAGARTRRPRARRRPPRPPPRSAAASRAAARRRAGPTGRRRRRSERVLLRRGAAHGGHPRQERVLIHLRHGGGVPRRGRGRRRRRRRLRRGRRRRPRQRRHRRRERRRIQARQGVAAGGGAAGTAGRGGDCASAAGTGCWNAPPGAAGWNAPGPDPTPPAPGVLSARSAAAASRSALPRAHLLAGGDGAEQAAHPRRTLAEVVRALPRGRPGGLAVRERRRRLEQVADARGGGPRPPPARARTLAGRNSRRLPPLPASAEVSPDPSEKWSSSGVVRRSPRARESAAAASSARRRAALTVLSFPTRRCALELGSVMRDSRVLMTLSRRSCDLAPSPSRAWMMLSSFFTCGGGRRGGRA